jgi:hypothetical protein
LACWKPAAVNISVNPLIGNGLADFVSQDERGFVLNAQVTGERQHALAFDFIAENGDGGEIVADRQFPAREDCSRRDRELLFAGFALPGAARRDA